MDLKPLDCGHLTVTQLHDQMEELNRAVGTNPSSQCGKRNPCNGCCHKNVKIFRDEAKLLLPYLPKDVTAGDLIRVTTRDDTDRAKQNRPCLFLGKDGKCSVYDIRPAICRAYFVSSDPKHCHKFSERGKINDRLNQGIMYLTASWWKAHPEQKPKLMEEQLIELLLEEI